MNGLRPVIGRNHYSRQFAARTCESAFGTPFVVPRRRRLDIDDVIGIAFAVIAVGLVTAWMAGLIQ